MDRPYKIKRPARVDKFILEHADKAYLIFDKKNDSVFCTIRNKRLNAAQSNLLTIARSTVIGAAGSV